MKQTSAKKGGVVVPCYRHPEPSAYDVRMELGVSYRWKATARLGPYLPPFLGGGIITYS